jgi:pyruvate,orthophosphate dikinase
MTFAFSRDDVASFLPTYLEKHVLDVDPFKSIDEDGVGGLIRYAIREGRTVKPDLKIGICGEHGGDPVSIDFCYRAGLSYVSCSPFRVPLARLAGAQAVINNPKAAAGEKPVVKKAAAVKPAEKKTAALKPADKKAAAKPADRKTTAKSGAKRPAGRPPANKTAALKPANKKAAAKPADRKTTAKPGAKRPVGRPPANKAAALKPAVKRPVGRPSKETAAKGKIKSGKSK